MKKRAPAAEPEASAPAEAAATSTAQSNPYNEHVRSTQLDAVTCAALARWQTERGVRSASAALRLLVQAGLQADGLLGMDERVRVARAGALREARDACRVAIDGLGAEAPGPDPLTDATASRKK